MSSVEAAFVSIVLVMMLTLLFIGWKTPEIVVFLALVLVWNMGTVSTDEAISGFNNPGVLAVGTLFVVIKGVERSHLAGKAARHVFGLQTSFRAGLARLMGLTFVLSAFFNNTPIVALLIPITQDWARTRGFSPSQFLMPLSFSCIFGGLVTIIGTSANLVVVGLVIEAAATDDSIGKGGLGFFEPGYIGFPLGIVGMVYLVFAAPLILPSGSAAAASAASEGKSRNRAEDLLTEVTRTFEYIGQPIALVLARLSIPSATLIKIRRKVPGEGRQGPLLRREEAPSTAALSSKPSSSSSHPVPHENNDLDAIESASPPVARMAVASSVPGGDGVMPRRITVSNSTGKLARRKHLGSSRASTEYGSPRLQTRKLAALSTATFDGNTLGDDAQREFHAENDGSHSMDVPLRSLPQCSVKGIGRTVAPLGLGPSDVAETQQPTSSSVLAATTTGLDANDGCEHSTKLGEDDIDIFPVAPSETLQDGDVLFLSCPRDAMIDFQGSIFSQRTHGLKILGVNALDLPEQGTELFEIVLSEFTHHLENSTTGGGHRNALARFSVCYGCRVLAVRHASSIPVVNTLTHQELAGSPELSRGRSATLELALHRNMSSGYSPVVGNSEGSPLPIGGRMTGRDDGSPTARIGSEANVHEVEVAHEPLSAGDFALVLSDEGFMKRWKDSDDFDLVTEVGSLPKPVRRYDYLALLVFCAMLGWVIFSRVIMVRAAMVAGGVLIVGGWVDARKAVGHVDWALLLLVGSALGLSKAICNSGLAGYAGDAIRTSGMSASASLYVLYGFTMICTELITNNAAAALAVPVALSIAKELEVSYKPFVITVMMAASSSFITPIGYQTNTMVWAPGGYKFSDFIKLGTPLSLLNLVVACFLMPYVFPF